MSHINDVYKKKANKFHKKRSSILFFAMSQAVLIIIKNNMVQLARRLLYISKQRYIIVTQTNREQEK